MSMSSRQPFAKATNQYEINIRLIELADVLLKREGFELADSLKAINSNSKRFRTECIEMLKAIEKTQLPSKHSAALAHTKELAKTMLSKEEFKSSWRKWFGMS